MLAQEIVTLSQRVDAGVNEVFALKTRVGVLTSTAAETALVKDDMSSRLVVAEQANRTRQGQLFALYKTLSEADAENNRLALRGLAAEERLSATTLRNDDLNTRLLAQETEIAEATRELDALRLKSAQMELERTSLVRECARLRDEHGRLAESYSELGLARTRLAQENVSLSDARSRLEKEHEKLAEEHTKLVQQAASLELRCAESTQRENTRTNALKDATRASERSERKLRAALAALVQVHRRELAARKEAMTSRIETQNIRAGDAYRLGEVALRLRPSGLGWFKALSAIRAEYSRPRFDRRCVSSRGVDEHSVSCRSGLPAIATDSKAANRGHIALIT